MTSADRDRVAFDGVRAGTATAVRYPRKQEQPGEVLRAAQSFFPLSLIVPSLARLARDQSLVIINRVRRRQPGIGEAVNEDQLAAMRLEFFEIGCVSVEPRSQCVVDRVHVMVEIECPPVEVVNKDPM